MNEKLFETFFHLEKWNTWQKYWTTVLGRLIKYNNDKVSRFFTDLRFHLNVKNLKLQNKCQPYNSIEIFLEKIRNI